MKTITEYVPLIFSRIAAHTAERADQRRRRKIDVLLITGYSVFGLWLFWDTGFAPWDYRFWGCFGPLFVAAELVVRVVYQSCGEDGGEHL